jgi:hypothetical protein
MKYYIAATILAIAHSQLTVVRELQSELLAENVPFNVIYIIDNQNDR